MLDGKVILPIVGQALVERAVLLRRNILRVTCPYGLSLVELFVRSLLLFDLLGLLLLRLIVLIFDLLYFGIFAFLGRLLFLILNFL